MRISDLKQGEFFRFTREIRVVRHLPPNAFELVYLDPYVLCRYDQYVWLGHQFQLFDVILDQAFIGYNDYAEIADPEVIKDMPCKCCYDCLLHKPYISITGCCSL